MPNENSSHEVAYNDGFQQGRNDGFQQGRNDGFQQGRNDGFQQGHKDGFQQGRNDGFQQGRNDGFQQGHKDGFQKGYNKGFQQGCNNGFRSGFNQGFSFIRNVLEDKFGPIILQQFAKEILGQNKRDNNSNEPPMYEYSILESGEEEEKKSNSSRSLLSTSGDLESNFIWNQRVEPLIYSQDRSGFASQLRSSESQRFQ